MYRCCTSRAKSHCAGTCTCCAARAAVCWEGSPCSGGLRPQAARPLSAHCMGEAHSCCHQRSITPGRVCCSSHAAYLRARAAKPVKSQCVCRAVSPGSRHRHGIRHKTQCIQPVTAARHILLARATACWHRQSKAKAGDTECPGDLASAIKQLPACQDAAPPTQQSMKREGGNTACG